MIPSSIKGSCIVKPIVRSMTAFAVRLVRSRVSLQLGILALRRPLVVDQQSIRTPCLPPSERLFWS